MSVELAYQSFIEEFKDSEVAIVRDSLDKVWIRATVVCEKLEFSDAHRTVKTYCKPHQYQQFKIGNGRPALYVNESGFYRLTLKSKSVIAEEFIDWLTEDVLPKLRASGGYVMPAATGEQLAALIKQANDQIKALYKARSVTYKKNRITGATTMTVLKNGVKEYETQISDYSTPSKVNPQVLIMRHFDWQEGVDNCTIDIDSPMKEAYVRFRDYSQVADRQWTFAEVEEWVRVNFPLR